jgi:hypothetical protein
MTDGVVGGVASLKPHWIAQGLNLGHGLAEVLHGYFTGAAFGAVVGVVCHGLSLLANVKEHAPPLAGANDETGGK